MDSLLQEPGGEQESRLFSTPRTSSHTRAARLHTPPSHHLREEDRLPKDALERLQTDRFQGEPLPNPEP